MARRRPGAAASAGPLCAPVSVDTGCYAFTKSHGTVPHTSVFSRPYVYIFISFLQTIL